MAISLTRGTLQTLSDKKQQRAEDGGVIRRGGIFAFEAPDVWPESLETF